MSDHTMSVTFEHERVRLVLVCHAPEGGWCRLTCAENCSSDSYPCFDQDDRSHELRDQGECNAVLFVNEAPELTAEPGSFPLHDGMPVDVQWDSALSCWQWAPTVAS